MPTDNNEGEILTIRQVADYLKVTERTIYRLAGAKKIPAFKVGGTWRFSRAALPCAAWRSEYRGFMHRNPSPYPLRSREWFFDD